MGELTPADRVSALLEWGDLAEADAAIDEAATEGDAWRPALWRGMRALMDGRFLAAERLAAEADDRGSRGGEPQAAVLAGLLRVALRREQERVAEAEILLRSLLEEHPSAPAGAHALLALLVAEMGRDGRARQELARLLTRDPVPAVGRLAPLCLLAEVAVAVDAPAAELDLLYGRLAPHARDFAVEEGGAVFYGSVALALARLAQAGGRWDDAVSHYEAAVEAHQAVGAPVLLAHTQRQLASLLRTRGADGDWERSVPLLASAVAIYRQLGVDGLAARTQAVLARCEDGMGGDGNGGGTLPEPAVFHREGDVWMVGAEAGPARLRDARGLHDIACLLARPGAAIHVADLLAGAHQGVRTPPYPPWELNAPVLDSATRREYEARLAELAGELVEAERGGDAVRAALVRAERDLLTAALTEPDGSDPLEQARRAVGTRIRISLERIEQAQPSVGRHLRAAIRTGTFCSYEPDRPLRWRL